MKNKQVIFGCPIWSFPGSSAAKTPLPQAFVEAPLRWASKAHQLLGFVGPQGILGDVGPRIPRLGPLTSWEIPTYISPII